jgi:hypothetical protein
MIEPRVLCQLCADLYAAKQGVFDHVLAFSDRVVGHKIINGVDIIVNRGSQNWRDWVRNLEALPIKDPNIGWIHAGMNVGSIDLVSWVAVNCGPKVVFTGHSLGGGRCRQDCARLAHAGAPALQCCVFGAPRSLFPDGCQILRDSPTLLQSYRNMTDPIPTVPTILPEWSHPDQWVSLSAPADPGDDDVWFRFHHSRQYIAGLAMLDETPTASLNAPGRFSGYQGITTERGVA